MAFACQDNSVQMLGANRLSGIVARELSGLRCHHCEVANETDRDATGDPEDAI